MKSLKTYLFLAGICCGAWWPVSSAQAVTLVGDSVTIIELFPDLSTGVGTVGPLPIVSGGTDFGHLGISYVSGIVYGLQIVLTPFEDYTPDPATFNGFDIRTLTSIIGSVSLNASSGGVFSLSLDPGGHDIFVNLQGIALDTLTPIIIDLTIIPIATPLPATLPLFASGLGVIGLLGWRRKRKNAALAA